MEKRGRDRLTSGVWLRALQAGDEVAESLILRAVQALGVGIGSAVSLLDVEAVVIGGGLGERLGPDWLARSRRPRTSTRSSVTPRASSSPSWATSVGRSARVSWKPEVGRTPTEPAR